MLQGGECLRCWNIILQGVGWGCSWMCGENIYGVVAVFVPVIDHRPPVGGSLIFEVCHIYPGKGFLRLLGQALDSSLLGYNEKKRGTHSLDLCNSRIIHVVSLSLLLFHGDVDSKGICPHNFTVY